VNLYRELLIMAVTLLVLAYAGQSIWNSMERQWFLYQQSAALKNGQAQVQEINQELKEGLANYRSSAGIEKLARERLNLAGPNEVIVRISK